jgi:FixJ family two-component response regulator
MFLSCECGNEIFAAAWEGIGADVLPQFGVREGPLPGLVHVIDDDPSFRTAIERRLKFAGYGVETYSSAEQLLDRLPDLEKPGCILLDVRLPGLTGLELQRWLTEHGSILPIIFVTAHSDTTTTVRAIKAGAEDFLTKPASAVQLIEAIERAMARFELKHGQQKQMNVFRGLVATLTPRERQVFFLIVHGKINKQIAFELGTSERTIKAHRQQVMEKMQVNSLAALVSIAERLGTVLSSAKADS